MTIQEAKLQCLGALMDEYGDREASIITDWVLERVTGWARIDRASNLQLPLSRPQLEELERCLALLREGMPVQYVLEECWFGGYRFRVNPTVLIPRPETDELVDWIAREQQRRQAPYTILDIGTGSGCIPIVLKKKLSSATVYGCDISDAALALASKNAADLAAAVSFIEIDFLNSANWQQLPVFDVLVSNPPYIPLAERNAMQRQVTAFEPSLALFVPDQDPLLFYRAIAIFGTEHLSAQGMIYLECHEDLAEETAALFRQAAYSSVEIREDMQGKQRMLKITKSG